VCLDAQIERVSFDDVHDTLAASRPCVAASGAEIDLHWHDLRHEAAACRWLAKGLDTQGHPASARSR
jgi:hypothetical protein